jgi:uncharacterized membrane-anchored protein
MQAENLPQIDARYWLAILLASVLGTVGSDFVSQTLGLGYVYGLPAMAAVFIFSLHTEKVSRVWGEAFYWTAVVVTRAAATSLADLATHQMGLGFESVAHILSVALLLAIFWPGRKDTNPGSLPAVDTRYWIVILIASVLGTTMGDYLSVGINFGTASASAMLLAAFAVALFLKGKARFEHEVFYWITLVIARTAGTTIADYLAGNEGLGYGALTVAVATAAVLFGLLVSYRQGKLITKAQLLAFFTAKRESKGCDERFWLFGVLAVASGQMVGQWGYTWLTYTEAQTMAKTIAPYIGGYEIAGAALYYTWLLPYMLAGLVAVVVVSWLTSKCKDLLYWLALYMTAMMAATWAEQVRYNGGFAQPAYMVAAVLVPLLLAVLFFTHRWERHTLAYAHSVKGVRLIHLALLFIALNLGVAVGNDLGTYLNQGNIYNTVILLIAFRVVLWIRSRTSQARAYLHEVMTWFACVMVGVVGYPLGNAVQSFVTAHWFSNTQESQGWSAIFVGVILGVLVWAWRPGVAWQSIAMVFYAFVRTCLRLAIVYWRALAGVGVICLGLGMVYLGNTAVIPLRSPQEVLYNQAMASLRTDLANQTAWSGFVHPETELFQQSLQYYEAQRSAGLIARLLYGEPDAVLASQANLKIGVILLYNAGQDMKLLNEAKAYLELAVKLNPGVPYAPDLLNHIGGSTAEINRLALMALAPERDLEMLYKKNPQARSKKPDKSKDGKGQDGKENGDQKGEPDQPNDDPGKQSDQQADKEGMTSKNTTLQQNMQDVKNGVANDGI